MKISTKGRYGLRALVDLASHAETGTVSLVNVAKRQKISLNYLEQVFATLRKAGIVKSQKGAQGGYLLARDPGEIRVWDILAALEGEFSIIDVVDPKNPQDLIQSAIQELVWNRINESVIGYTYGQTLTDLVEKYEKMNGDEKWIYHI